MSLIRWDPFADLGTMRQSIGRFFDDSFFRLPLLGRAGRIEPMAVDMYQPDGDVVVKATLPGVSPDDVDVTITGDVLTIKGESKAEQEVKEESYYRESAGTAPSVGPSLCPPI